MKLRVTGLFVASMLCSTAVTPAFAQQADAQDPQNAQACEQLDQVVQQNPEFQQVWLDEAQTAADAGDPGLCVQYVAQAEQVTQQGDQAERIEGRIVVSQEPPTVNVEQPAPEVSVTQPEPRVSVTQPQPEIIVRQVPPTIRIEMPEPVVTIDQPQPEIIVRMPDPQVSVETPQPQIDVNQAQPRVSVQQGEPQLDVAVDDTVNQQGQEEANVQVQQGTPQVRLQQQQQQDGQAQVDVQQAQPRVTYESAEPQIEFSGGNQPQVQFTESGEPNVSFVGEDGQPQQQQAGQQQAGQQQQAQQQAAQQQAGTAGANWRGERSPMAAPTRQVEGYQQAEASQISVDNLMGADVYGANDENIGNVQDAVATQEGQVEFIVLDIGGFLGIGARQVALGMDEVTVMHDGGDDLRVYVDATREQLEQMPEYNAN